MDSKNALLNIFKDNNNLEISAKDMRDFVEAVYADKIGKDDVETTVAISDNPIASRVVSQVVDRLAAAETDAGAAFSMGVDNQAKLAQAAINIDGNVQDIDDIRNTQHNIVGEVTTLTGTTHQLDQRVAQNTNDIINTDKNAAAISADVVTLEGRLNVAFADIQSNTTSTARATVNIQDIANDLAQTDNNLAQTQAALTTLDGEVNKNTQDILDGTHQMNGAMARFVRVEADFAQAESDIQDNHRDIQNTKVDVTNINATLGNHDIKIDANTTQLAKHDGEIQALQKTKNLEPRLAKLEGEIQQGFTRVTDVETLMSTLDVDVKANTKNLASTSTTIATMGSQLTDINQRTTHLERKTDNTLVTQSVIQKDLAKVIIESGLSTAEVAQLKTDTSKLNTDIAGVVAWKNIADSKLNQDDADIKDLKTLTVKHTQDITDLNQDLTDHNQKLAKTISDVTDNSQAIVVNANNIRQNNTDINNLKALTDPVQIKTYYESNPDTNAFTDRYKRTLDAIDLAPSPNGIVPDSLQTAGDLTVGHLGADTKLTIQGTVNSSSWLKFKDIDKTGQIAESASIGYEANSKDLVVRNSMNGGDIVLEPSDPAGRVYIRVGNKKHELFANKGTFKEITDAAGGFNINREQLVVGTSVGSAGIRILSGAGGSTFIGGEHGLRDAQGGVKFEWTVGLYPSSTAHGKDLTFSNADASGGFVFKTDKPQQQLRVMDTNHVFSNIVTSKTIDKLEAQVKPADIVAGADFAKAYNDLLTLLETAGILV